MTSTQLDSIHTALNKLKVHQSKLTSDFLCKIYQLDPALRSRIQRNKLGGPGHVDLLLQSLTSIRNLEPLLPRLQDLARELQAGGIKHSDFDTLGMAYIAVVGKQKEHGLSDEEVESLIVAYSRITKVLGSYLVPSTIRQTT